MDTYKLKWTVLELEIFSFLCVTAGEKFSQRDIAKTLKFSPTAVANAVKSLLKKGFIHVEKTKTINFVSFNRENEKAIELKRAENLKQIYISGLSEFLEEQFPGTTIILFGSYSRGEDTKSSDIDFAIIGAKDKMLNIEKFENNFRKEINLNMYNSWKEIHKHLKNNILNGIILSGSVDV